MRTRSKNMRTESGFYWRKKKRWTWESRRLLAFLGLGVLWGLPEIMGNQILGLPRLGDTHTACRESPGSSVSPTGFLAA